MVYLAKRYLQMEPEEWDALPWYMSQMYEEGFKKEGILSDGEGPAQQSKGHKPSRRLDLTSGTLPANWNTRRAPAAG